MLTPGIVSSGSPITAFSANINASAIQNLTMRYRDTPQFIRSAPSTVGGSSYIHPFKVSVSKEKYGGSDCSYALVNVFNGRAIVHISDVAIGYSTGRETYGGKQFIKSIFESYSPGRKLEATLFLKCYPIGTAGEYYVSLVWDCIDTIPCINVLCLASAEMEKSHQMHLAYFNLDSCMNVRTFKQFWRSDWHVWSISPSIISQ